ncbi:MAG: hypothetical protein IH987_02340, partial [Planctomycetes bacterium]|nr:hypothetical protein [Planctomycetota bacterium]
MKRNFRIGGAALVAFLSCLNPTQANSEGRAPANLDFENGTVGDAPPGWLVDPSGPGYSAVLTEEGVKSGKQCVVLTRSAGADSPVGNLMQSVDAAPYHGKIVRYRAAVRTSVSHPLRVQLWMRVDRPDGTGGFFDNMNDRPITADHWQSFEIVGEVADDAKDIKIGVFVMGEGQAWIDDVSLEIVGDFVQASEPPRPLVGRSLDILVAFTKLLGYVRYFHPSDEAAATDWDQFSIAGVRRVEGASSPADLVRILKELFRPVAPAVHVFPTRERPEASASPAPPTDASACKVITWRHFGVGTGSTRSIYTSEREDASEPWYVGDGAGGITFNLDAGPYRGKRIRLRAAVRAEVAGKNSQAQLEFIVSRPRYQTGFMDDMADRPITSDEWQEIVIIGRVDDDATLLNFGAHLVGEGRVWVDELTIELVGDADPPSAEMILRTDFERGDIDAALAGWVLADESRREGYSISVTKDRPYSGRRCLLLDGTNLRKKQVPKPGEPFIAELGGGVSCAVPMALWATESGTLPAAKAEQDSSASADTQVPRPSGGDRATRLAAVGLAWNVFQHFYPYFDVVHADWPAELRRALTAAANDSDERAFLDTLRRLVAALHDGHGRVYGM